MMPNSSCKLVGPDTYDIALRMVSRVASGCLIKGIHLHGMEHDPLNRRNDQRNESLRSRYVVVELDDEGQLVDVSESTWCTV